MCAYFGRAKPCLELQQPPPAVVWPNLPDNAARLEWYRQCIAAYAETLHSISCEPLSLFELDQLEQALGCALPTLLREYLHQLGYLNLAETLIVPEPLLDFYPGIEDILEDLPADEAIGERAVVESLVAFGDYLGNGNAWCFHRETGAVWYFDHDSPPHWQPMFPRIEDYLDSLMLLSLMQGVDDDIDENLFRQRFGDALIEKWMY
ncbi:SMI1/KNR4 family protein [Lysobacteraceae bacterium NML08-0793]|nr:SMI1/KNR4 family protein [Xanthomonadaceae bacterium NML08-0793]